MSRPVLRAVIRPVRGSGARCLLQGDRQLRARTKNTPVGRSSVVVYGLCQRRGRGDTILSLGLMICFYYGLTAFAATFYFRYELTRSVKSFLLKGVAPFVGGLTLAAIFVQLVIDTTDPEYGSGGSIFGLGTVFVLGVGVLLLGAVFMVFWQAREPAFFRGEVLKRETPPH